MRLHRRQPAPARNAPSMAYRSPPARDGLAKAVGGQSRGVEYILAPIVECRAYIYHATRAADSHHLSVNAIDAV